MKNALPMIALLLVCLFLSLGCAKDIQEPVSKEVFFKNKVHETLHLMGLLDVNITVHVVPDDYVMHALHPESVCAIFQVPLEPEESKYYNFSFMVAIKTTFLEKTNLHTLTHVATHETCHAKNLLDPHIFNVEIEAERCVWQTRGDKFFVTTYRNLWKDNPDYNTLDYKEFRDMLIRGLLKLPAEESNNWTPVDPEPWYKKHTDQLYPATWDSLQKISKEFEITHSAVVQAALFEEDLNWMQRGYSDRQVDFMVAVALQLAVNRAMKEFEAMDDDPKLKATRKRIGGFIFFGTAEIDRRREDLDNLRDYELLFYY